MGLIKMAVSSVSSTFADQVVEYFRCDGITGDTMCIPATKVVRGKAVNNGTADYISSGSTFDVAINQAALLVEDGKVWDMVVATTNDIAGQYKYDSSTAPSILGSGLKDVMPSIKEIGNRFAAGGQARHTMRLVYVNLREIIANPVGFGKMPFREAEIGPNGLSITVQGHGTYNFQITDPGRFYERWVKDISKPFARGDDGDGAEFIKTLKSQMQPKFQIALGGISKLRIPYDQLGEHADDFAKEMNAAMAEKWAEYGITLTSIDMTLTADEKSMERINKWQETMMASGNPSLLYAMDRMSINTAREAAANNSAGAMTGFMGMGMAGGAMGQAMDPTMYNQQMQQNMANQQYQQQQYQQQPQPQQQSAPAPTPAADSWTCECGQTNTGKFCQGCGKPKPAPKPAADGWTCSCGAVNTGKFCMECGKPQPAPAPEGWTCSCGTVNKGKFCAECGAKKPAAEPLYKCDKCGWEPADPKHPPKFCPQCGDPFDDNDIQ